MAAPFDRNGRETPTNPLRTRIEQLTIILRTPPVSHEWNTAIRRHTDTCIKARCHKRPTFTICLISSEACSTVGHTREVGTGPGLVGTQVILSQSSHAAFLVVADLPQLLPYVVPEVPPCDARAAHQAAHCVRD
jgi:hypothetical protein